MNIAHVVSTFPPYLGGTGNVAFQHCRGLARLGHHVEVFTSTHSSSPAQETLDGITVHRIRPLFKPGNSALMPQLLWRLSGFHLVHWHYPFLGGEFAALCALLTHTPLVITYHMDLLLTGWKGQVERLLFRPFNKAIMRAAHKVLYASPDYAAHSYSHQWLTVKPTLMGILPHGVDVSRYSPGTAPTELLRQYRSNPAERIVLMVSALDRAHYFKGVDVLLNALAALPAEVRGIIVGDGELRQEYMQLAESLGIARRVHFTGSLSESDLPAYYRLADVSVLPSTTMGEAFGLVLVESLACGTPVIASSLPGVRAVVSPGVDGLLAKPGEACDLGAAIARMLTLPEEKRREMGAAGRYKALQQYDWQHIVQQLEAIYQQVMAAED